jgi:hypothetical protein
VSLRVYPGPAPRFAAEAARWALRVRPRAPRVDAERIEVRTLDGSVLPMQADGDVIGGREAWMIEIRPAAVRLIGAWTAVASPAAEG